MKKILLCILIAFVSVATINCAQGMNGLPTPTEAAGLIECVTLGAKLRANTHQCLRDPMLSAPEHIRNATAFVVDYLKSANIFSDGELDAIKAKMESLADFAANEKQQGRPFDIKARWRMEWQNLKTLDFFKGNKELVWTTTEHSLVIVYLATLLTGPQRALTSYDRFARAVLVGIERYPARQRAEVSMQIEYNAQTETESDGDIFAQLLARAVEHNEATAKLNAQIHKVIALQAQGGENGCTLI